jgi:DNA-binding GntR family transcriptional regulator
VLKLSRLHSLSLEGRLQQSLEEHRVIMAAFEAGDAEKAEKSMHDHLLYGREALAKMERRPAERFPPPPLSRTCPRRVKTLLQRG